MKPEEKVRAIYRDWLRILAERLVKELNDRGIHDTGKLEMSIKTEIVAASGDGANMNLDYLLYGMFVDMNVGRGRTLEDAADNRLMDRHDSFMAGRRHSRRAKKYQWYSRRMGKEMYILGALLGEFYADESVDVIMRTMPDRIHLLM